MVKGALVGADDGTEDVGIDVGALIRTGSAITIAACRSWEMKLSAEGVTSASTPRVVAAEIIFCDREPLETAEDTFEDIRSSKAEEFEAARDDGSNTFEIAKLMTTPATSFIEVGRAVGLGDGALVGTYVGSGVGPCVGSADGRGLGRRVGSAVGFLVHPANIVFCLWVILPLPSLSCRLLTNAYSSVSSFLPSLTEVVVAVVVTVTTAFNLRTLLFEEIGTPHRLVPVGPGIFNSLSENPVASRIAFLNAAAAASPLRPSSVTNLSSKLATTQTKVCLGNEGAVVGWVVGCREGCAEGSLVGWIVGWLLGPLGWDEGCIEGCREGCFDGCAVGSRVGWVDGCIDGRREG